MHNVMAKNASGREITPLQGELLRALIDSGISKDALLGACDELYAKLAQSGQRADGTADQQGDKPKHDSSNPLQGMQVKSEAVKLEESPRRTLSRDASLEAQQINFVDQMLRYAFTSLSRSISTSTIDRVLCRGLTKIRISCCQVLLIC